MLSQVVYKCPLCSNEVWVYKMFSSYQGPCLSCLGVKRTPDLNENPANIYDEIKNNASSQNLILAKEYFKNAFPNSNLEDKRTVHTFFYGGGSGEFKNNRTNKSYSAYSGDKDN